MLRLNSTQRSICHMSALVAAIMLIYCPIGKEMRSDVFFSTGFCFIWQVGSSDVDYAGLHTKQLLVQYLGLAIVTLLGLAATSGDEARIRPSPPLENSESVGLEKVKKPPEIVSVTKQFASQFDILNNIRWRCDQDKSGYSLEFCETVGLAIISRKERLLLISVGGLTSWSATEAVMSVRTDGPPLSREESGDFGIALCRLLLTNVFEVYAGLTKDVKRAWNASDLISCALVGNKCSEDKRFQDYLQIPNSKALPRLGEGPFALQQFIQSQQSRVGQFCKEVRRELLPSLSITMNYSLETVYFVHRCLVEEQLMVEEAGFAS